MWPWVLFDKCEDQKNICVPSIFSELNSFPWSKTVWERLFQLHSGATCQEYCRFCKVPQLVSWCRATTQTYAKSDSRVSQKEKLTKTDQMRGQIWKFDFPLWSQMWTKFVQSNKSYSSTWKLQIRSIFYFKLHFSYSWDVIFFNLC